jgi:hypothetical protein
MRSSLSFQLRRQANDLIANILYFDAESRRVGVATGGRQLPMDGKVPFVRLAHVTIQRSGSLFARQPRPQGLISGINGILVQSSAATAVGKSKRQHLDNH